MEQLAQNFLSQQSGATAAWIGVISVAIFVIVKIRKAITATWPFVKKFVAVVEDLFGAEARPGVEARPGLMARMKKSEENDVLILATVAEHSTALLELQPNHGGSMKDVLNTALAGIKEQGRTLVEQGARADRLEEILMTHINEQRAAVVNAEASVVNAEAAASGARDAVIGAREAVVGAQEAVVGARQAVVHAESAVIAATADRAAVNVHVTNTP